MAWFWEHSNDAVVAVVAVGNHTFCVAFVGVVITILPSNVVSVVPIREAAHSVSVMTFGNLSIRRVDNAIKCMGCLLSDVKVRGQDKNPIPIQSL